jgi:hypothetical protein
MEEKVKKSLLDRIPAWVLSLLISFVTIIYVIIQDDQGMRRELAGQDRLYIGPLGLREIIDFFVFLVVIPSAIFLICRKHPKSFWYTPILGNAFGLGMGCMVILSFILNWDPVTYTDWLIWVGTLLLSIVAAIYGARIGRQRKLTR